MTNREIAATLFVTTRTVEVHLTHAYQKLDITSREQLQQALHVKRARQDSNLRPSVPRPRDNRPTPGG